LEGCSRLVDLRMESVGLDLMVTAPELQALLLEALNPPPGLPCED